MRVFNFDALFGVEETCSEPNNDIEQEKQVDNCINEGDYGATQSTVSLFFVEDLNGNDQ